MRKRIRLAATIAVIAIALFGAAALGWFGHASTIDSPPGCPTEDSCTIDYRDGAWHIEADTP